MFRKSYLFVFLHHNYTTIFFNLAKNLFMIQRIQTIYLAIAAICILLTLFIPFSSYSFQNETEVFGSFGFSMKTVEVTIFPVIYNIAISLFLFLLSIFSFKNRKRQLQLNMVNFAVIIIFIALIFVDFDKIETAFNFEKEDINYGLGMFLPIVSLVGVFMANRAIKSDEKLIKSMDRIR